MLRGGTERSHPRRGGGGRGGSLRGDEDTTGRLSRTTAPRAAVSPASMIARHPRCSAREPPGHRQGTEHVHTASAGHAARGASDGAGRGGVRPHRPRLRARVEGAENASPAPPAHHSDCRPAPPRPAPWIYARLYPFRKWARNDRPPRWRRCGHGCGAARWPAAAWPARI